MLLNKVVNSTKIMQYLDSGDITSYYNMRDNDKAFMMKQLENHETQPFLIVNHHRPGVYFGMIERVDESFLFHLISKYEEKSIVDAFTEDIQWNQIDFPEDRYVTDIEMDANLMHNLHDGVYLKNHHKFYQGKLSAYEEALPMRPVAHKSYMSTRLYDIRIEDERSEYQKDVDRISYSKAYRRLVDKAQVFSTKKGDHFRTRLTHTLEVSRISRTIARALSLNEDLTEAIAQGHDIGHTPFGHQGERSIDELLKFYLTSARTEFKHNFQAMRVLNEYEERYLAHPGLNLTTQTLEGILKHTGLKKNKKCSDYMTEKGICRFDVCEQRCLDMEAFIPSPIIEKLHLNYDYPTTLEGQVVAIADEIAQRSHDYEDAISANMLTLQEILDQFKLIFTSENSASAFNKEMVEAKGRGRKLYNVRDLLKARVSPMIINHFIKDVIDQSKWAIDQYMTQETEKEYFKEQHCVNTVLIDFSSVTKRHNDYLEHSIISRAISSEEVSKFDYKGSKIVTALFNTYYNNPSLLPKSELARIRGKLERQGIYHYEKLNSEKKLLAFLDDLRIKTDNDKEHQQRLMHLGIDERKGYEIYLRAISDFIGGMTDQYAMKTYDDLIASPH